MAKTHFSGGVVETSRAAGERRDLRLFVTPFMSSAGAIAGAQGTWTPTRVAANQWSLRRTAGASTHIYAYQINMGMLISNPAQTAAQQVQIGEVPRGAQITRLDLVFGIGTDVLNAHTATLNRVTYNDSSAPTVTAVTIAGTLATATNAQPQIDSLTPSASPVIEFNEILVLEVTVNATATAVYDAYGLSINFNLLL